MLGVEALGRRVSVRTAVAGGFSDVVGHLVGRADTAWQVLRPSGEVATIDPAAVVAAKVVPPAPVRRGWAVPDVSPAEMQRICWAGWPARETEQLGEWVLRAHGGITGRANSAMAIGDPGCPLPQALEHVARWYSARGLPPLLQLPLADPANLVMDECGWTRQHVTIVQTAPIAPVLAELAQAPVRPDLRAHVATEPDDDWRGLMHDLDEQDPQAHEAILTGPPVVGFATVRRRNEPVGIGRVSVEGQWAGVTSVDVAPSARRGGIGTAVMQALLSWAAGQGAVASYLQVRAGNDAALRLYARLGYATHHPYTYRALP